jgi:hypothetical protein
MSKTGILLVSSTAASGWESFQKIFGKQKNKQDTEKCYKARICRSFKEPRNRFPAWRNRFLDSINVYE